MELNFKEKFHLLLKFMKINQTHPYLPRGKKWTFYFIISQGLYATEFYMLFYSVCHDLKIKNYSVVCQNAVAALVYIENTFYCMVMLRYQKILVSLMETMKKDYEAKIPSDMEIVIQYANRGSRFCKLWGMLTIIGGMLFPVKHLVISIYFCMTDGCRRTNIFDITYPSPIEEYKTNIFVYIILYSLLLFYFLFSITCYMIFGPLEPLFMLHACGQFEIVKRKIGDLFKDSTGEQVREKLKSIVMQLQSIYSFVEIMKTCFREANELTLKFVPFLLPITYYQLVESHRRGEDSVEFISIMVGSILLSSAWCYYSDLLMEKGEDVALAVYSCGWESRCDRRTRTTLALVLLRAQVPVGMRAMFCTLCLDTLADVFRQAYAIFNLMNAVWN